MRSAVADILGFLLLLGLAALFFGGLLRSMWY
jgi:hypothetical protein